MIGSSGQARKLKPVAPFVNASMVHARHGNDVEAERLLRRALKTDPANAEANFNFGLLLAERGDHDGAERHLRVALKTDATLARAAYNLAVLVSRESLSEAIDWCRKAARLRPDEPKYAYTLAFYLTQREEIGEAESILKRLIKEHLSFADAYILLATLYERAGRREDARDVYRQALRNLDLTERDRFQLELKIRSLRP